MSAGLALHRGSGYRYRLYRATIAAAILPQSSPGSGRITQPYRPAIFALRWKVYVPFTASPGTTREANCTLWYLSIMFPNHRHAANGTIVLSA